MNIQDELNTTRLLFFMETNPQSNKYYQILLTEKQFKQVSDALAGCFEKQEEKDLREGYEMFELKISEDEYSLPDLQQII